MIYTPVDVVYFIEHVARELDIACIVKYLCESRYGLNVKIVSLRYDSPNEIIYHYKPTVVTLPFFYSRDDWGISNILAHWHDAIYLNLSYEQFISKINKKNKAPKDSFTKEKVYHNAWGNFFSDYLLQCGVNKDKILVNGNPSYMLYQKPYSNYFPDKAAIAKKYNLCPEKKWLFFPMNYGWGFFTDEWIESYVRSGYDSKVAYENRALCKESLREVILWWEEAAKNEEVELIVRPRPAIRKQEYDEKFKEVLGKRKIPKGISIIKEGSIREWILASDIIFSSFSTSLLEAAIADKPTYIMEPLEFPEWLHCDWFELLTRIRKKETFLEICSRSPEPHASSKAKKYLYATSLNQGDAISNIATTLHKLCQNSRNVCAKETIEELKTSISLEWQKWRKSRELRNSEKNEEFQYDGVKSDSFTQYDVAKRIKKWKRVL